MASGAMTSSKIDGGTMKSVIDLIFLGFKSTMDSDCSHQIKRCLFLGRKAMTNLDSILKIRNICQRRFRSFQFKLLSCPTLCDPMDRSMPGFPVHHQLLELTQTHVHRVGDTIQPSHPLSSPYPAFNLSHHQSLFQ